MLIERKKVTNTRYVFLLNISLSVAIRVLMMHATACAAERNWSAWKRFCMAERAGMTPEHFKQCMMVAVDADCSKSQCRRGNDMFTRACAMF